MVKGTGATWAGSKITMAAPINLSTERVFKVKVFSPVAGIKLLLKFEGAGSFFQKLSSPNSSATVVKMIKNRVETGSDSFIMIPVNPRLSMCYLRTGSPIGSLDFQRFF